MSRATEWLAQCKACTHHKAPQGPLDVDRCILAPNQDKASGHYSCYVERLDHTTCGPNGNRYTPKEPNPKGLHKLGASFAKANSHTGDSPGMASAFSALDI